jgi:menaquinone-specific isochorismate synthase
MRRLTVELVDGAPDPLAAIAAAPHADAFYWRSDATGELVAGLGCLLEVRATGADRFADARRAMVEAGVDDARVRWLGGFAFRADGGDEAFPALRFVVPRLLWRRDAEGLRMWCLSGADAADRAHTAELAALAAGAATSLAEPGRSLGAAGGETHASWCARVDAARAAIERGELCKVVLARRSVLRIAGQPGAEALVGRLADERPRCWSFLVRHAGESFLGSTPERLLRVEGTRLAADALAGSRPRGADAAEDARWTDELLASHKDRAEHDFVVEHLQRVLARDGGRVRRFEQPAVLALPEAFHLHTPMAADLAAPLHVLEAARRLHPTPAVCGTPRERAEAWIAAGESDRGWYGGGVGWVAGNGDGEISVALRTARVAEGRAELWAGAGIVAASEPEREWAETETKLDALRSYLEVATRERAA